MLVLMSLDARTFADMLADPAAAELLSAVASCPLISIEVPDAAAARPLAGLQVTTLPAVWRSSCPILGACRRARPT
jgi:hypothetical protein